MGFFDFINSIWQSIFSVSLSSWGSLFALLCLGSVVAGVLALLLPSVITFLKLLGIVADNLVETIWKVIVATIVVGAIVVIVWGMMDPEKASEAITTQVVESIPAESQETIPTDSIPVETQPIAVEQAPAVNGICWSYELRDFSGTRWRAWEMIAKKQVGDVMEWEEFKTEVLNYNEILIKDEYEFFSNQVYILPQKCP